MLIDERPVSRKTPLDGKLEISPEAAARLGALGEEFALASAGRAGRGRLEAMTCTCAKAASAGSHLHHFIESPLLKALVPGSSVRVELEADRKTLRVEPAPPPQGASA